MPGCVPRDVAQLADPGLHLREEDRVPHRHRDLPALDRLGALVGRLELRVHPLLAEEAGAVLGDAVAAHERDGLAQHGRADAGVPELRRGAEDVGLRVEEREADDLVGSQLGDARAPPWRRGGGPRARAARARSSPRASSTSSRAFMPVMPCACSSAFFCFSSGSSSSNRRAVAKPSERRRLARRPDLHEPVERVLALLDAELVADRAGRRLLRAAEAAALVADDRLDRGEELRGGHHADRDARAPEDRLDHLASGRSSGR